ncbi:phosphodiester glycosidase family protein [uncultured Tyzzerella sp.]|uniref:phosphodiester glycosidase family protein n=1 Tax=uncultured Tyzzerella sp. TaxID=2321398 RepID=UPI002941E870|nr:phosphodiester glycosidase family protein [uncultured Tyzzerella sp.]
MKKKFLTYTLAFALSLSTFITKNVFADSNLLYVDKEVQTLTDGLTYEKSERLYKSGWKDVYVLIADLKNPNIDIEILDSVTEHGLKKNVEALTKENNAIAGINADFFGSGNPGSSMGQIIVDGNVNEAQNYYNSSSNKYAGIFLDKYGNAFIDYIKSNLRLYNEKVSLNLQAKNKITDFKTPIYFDRSVITNTTDLDKRNKNLFKIVVEDKKIVKKAGAGEVVEIPENGYIIVMDKATASEKLALFNVGDNLTFTESYKFVFRDGKNISDVMTGISAGGEILRNGKPISTGMSISPNSRNPRSAVGVNKEKNKLILIAVDGRGKSTGATHSEMANILLEYGAYDAIHLDGGGSTTVALREEGSKDVKIVNDVSDKSPRLVPNAIGVKSTNPPGDLASLLVSVDKKSDDSIISGLTYSLKVTGIDANKNPVDIDPAQVTFTFEDESIGTINGSYFLCNTPGDITINATYPNGVTGQVSFKVMEAFNSIIPKANNTSLYIGENTPLFVEATNNDGFSKIIDASSVSWSVDNENLGYIKNNTFYAVGEGTAILTATYNGFSASITIAIGSSPSSITSFEEKRNLFMMYFPADKTVSGGAGITNAAAYDGKNSLLLSYNFKENVSTPQASYVCFERQPITLKDSPNAIQMQIKGDGSGNMVKMVLKDKNNKEYVLPILNEMTSKDWVTANVPIPDDVAYPVRIDKIYVATQTTTAKESGTIYIDAINSMNKRTDGGVLTNSYKDPLNQNISQVTPTSEEEDINVFGQTDNKPHQNSKKVLQDSVNVMKNNARAIVFAGPTKLDDINTGVPTVSWDNKYNTTNTSNLSIINLATKSGVMRTESPDQWRWLQSYLQNQSKNNILINMDKNIWDKNNSLKGKKENELLHKILKDFVAQTGKKVIVVSAVSDKSNVYVKDGVRYITLNGLTNPDPNNLSNYKYLKIRASQNDLKYEICNVYNN